MKRLLLSGLLLCSAAVQANVYKLTTEVVQRIKKGSIDSSPVFNCESILKSYAEKLDQLLQHGAHIDVTGDNGETSLMVAVQLGSEDLVKILLDRDAAVNKEDKDGFTAMMHLVKKWITIDGSVSYIVRFTPVDSEWAQPEKCLELLLDGGSEPFEYALLKVEHAVAKKNEQQELEKYTGFKRFVMSFKKLNPTKLAEKATRRIKMRRLRKEQENA